MSHSNSRFLPHVGMVSLGVLALSVSAAAQGFNVDFNSATVVPGPAATYAAAGTPGVWNAVVSSANNFALVDKSGAASPVTITVSPSLSFSLWFDNINMTGDDAALLEDIIYGGTTGIFYPVTFNGLANGDYDVYTYAIAPDSKTGFITDVDVTESTDGVQAVGGFVFTGHAQGVSYAKHAATVSAGTLTVLVRINTSFISLNGIQIEPAGSGCPVTEYCNGDGSGTPCPFTNNDGSAGIAGCANSVSAGGAKLTSTGCGDSLVLVASSVPHTPGVFFQGNNAVNFGNGVVSFDGLRCAGGGIIRLERILGGQVVGNTATSTVHIASVGGVVPGSGEIRRYQYWYRDTAAGLSGSNLSNGLEVVW